jgi:YfiR/HmsC-like
METPACSPATAVAPLSQASQRARPLPGMEPSQHTVPLLREFPPGSGGTKRQPSRSAGVGAVWVVLSLCLVLACSGLTHAAPVAEPIVDEYQVKAAFLFNFAKFVEWPTEAFSNPNAPLVITVFGEDPFNGSLEAVKGKLVNNRKLTIRRVKDIQDIGKTNVLFVSPSAKKELARILEAQQGQSVLTVGEDGVFTQCGGIINFVKEDNRVRFEVNVSAAERAGLKISSRLLALARIVKSLPQGGGK